MENKTENLTRNGIVTIPKMKVSNEIITYTNDIFRSRCMNNGIKYKSKEFYKLQIEYFSGAMATLEALGYQYPPSWYLLASTNKKIIEKY